MGRNLQEEVDTLNEVVFGNEKTKTKGIAEKVDEMHTILTQAKGLRGFLYIMIAIGGAVAVLKGFITK